MGLHEMMALDGRRTIGRTNPFLFKEEPEVHFLHCMLFGFLLKNLPETFVLNSRLRPGWNRIELTNRIYCNSQRETWMNGLPVMLIRKNLTQTAELKAIVENAYLNDCFSTMTVNWWSSRSEREKSISLEQWEIMLSYGRNS